MGKVIVKKSKIEGTGAFATQDFKKGDIVIKWDTSHKVHPDEISKLSEEEKQHTAFMGKEVFLQQAPAKYVNHSCEPNTHVKDFCDVAIKDIKKGEEITSDYSECLGVDEVIICTCGSKNCKKVIKK
jgi:hypothetical protein